MYFPSTGWALAWAFISVAVVSVTYLWWWLRNTRRRPRAGRLPPWDILKLDILPFAATILLFAALLPLALANMGLQGSDLGTCRATVAALRHTIATQQVTLDRQQGLIDGIQSDHRRLAEEVASLKAGCPACQPQPAADSIRPRDADDWLGPFGWSGLLGIVALFSGLLIYFRALEVEEEGEKMAGEPATGAS